MEERGELDVVVGELLGEDGGSSDVSRWNPASCVERQGRDAYGSDRNIWTVGGF